MNALQTNAAVKTADSELAEIERHFFDNPEVSYDGIIDAITAMGTLADAYEKAMEQAKAGSYRPGTSTHAESATVAPRGMFHQEAQNTLRNLQKYSTHLTETLARLLAHFRTCHGYDPLAVEAK
jgi:predicted double-glycine peptidase